MQIIIPVVILGILVIVAVIKIILIKIIIVIKIIVVVIVIIIKIKVVIIVPVVIIKLIIIIKIIYLTTNIFLLLLGEHIYRPACQRKYCHQKQNDNADDNAHNQPCVLLFRHGIRTIRIIRRLPSERRLSSITAPCLPASVWGLRIINTTLILVPVRGLRTITAALILVPIGGLCTITAALILVPIGGLCTVDSSRILIPIRRLRAVAAGLLLIPVRCLYTICAILIPTRRLHTVGAARILISIRGLCAIISVLTPVRNLAVRLVSRKETVCVRHNCRRFCLLYDNGCLHHFRRCVNIPAAVRHVGIHINLVLPASALLQPFPLIRLVHSFLLFYLSLPPKVTSL